MLNNVYPIHLTDGLTLNIKIKRSTRSKGIRLRADIYEIRVIAPFNYEFQNLLKFVETRMDWIFKITKYYRRLIDSFGQQNNINQGSIYFLGAEYKLQIVRDKVPFNVTSNNPELITFYFTDKRTYRKDLTTWYKSQISKIIFERLSLISSKLNLGYKGVLIKSHS